MKYVVEVEAPLPDDMGPAISSVAAAFNIGEDRARNLLDRAPGTVTKAVSEREAKAVARIFMRAGLQVVVQPRPEPGEAVPPPPEPQVVIQPGPEPVEVTPPPPEPVASAASSTMVREADSAPSQPSPLVSEVREPSFEATSIPSPPSEPAATVSSRWGAEASPGQIAEVSTPAAAVETRGRTRSDFDQGPVELPEFQAPKRRLRRRRLRRRILSAGIVPALLAVVFTLAAAAVMVRNLSETLLVDSASNPVIALAGGAEAILEGSSLRDPVAVQRLHQLTLSTQQDFLQRNISFVLVTDTEGNRLAGWYGDDPGLTTVPEELIPAIQLEVRDAATRESAGDEGVELGTIDPASRELPLIGSPVDVTSKAIRVDGAVAGAVLVGIARADLYRQLLLALLIALGAGLVPVLVGMIAVGVLTRRMTRSLSRLAGTADKISRGNLAQSVEMERDVELDEIATAIERMRVSLQEGMDRLRRRRR